MWNYLFYIAYLNDKDEIKYTGIESYISLKIKKYDCSWFPINRFNSHLKKKVINLCLKSYRAEEH